VIGDDPVERFDTIVVGGGQAGLAAGYHLRRRGRPFVLLDARPRTGDSWRTRWDSLRLFSPRRYSELAGLRFPGRPEGFPGKDEMASYLEDYAAHFALPVRHRMRVERLWLENDRYVLRASGTRFEADHVIVAAGGMPWTPSFADDLEPGIRQLHAVDYRRPAQLVDGAVLVVGTGNTGAEIALELAATRRVLLSGRDVGQLPGQFPARAPLRTIAVGVGILRHWPTVESRVGRRLRARLGAGGTPRIRVKRTMLAAAGVERVPRVVGAAAGRPLLADGRTLEVGTVVWCTGYRWHYPWIDVPTVGAQDGLPAAPGLHFLGVPFQRTAVSAFVAGIDTDAARVVRRLDQHRAG
jgi:putative flavoprotein involved in K+ transport